MAPCQGGSSSYAALGTSLFTVFLSGDITIATLQQDLFSDLIAMLFFFLKNIWHLVMGRAAKWTFSQGWKYRKSYTLGGVLEGKPFPLPFCWLFFFVSLSRSEKNPTPSSERRVTSRPSGQNRDFPTGSLLGSFVVDYGEEAWMGANAGNVQWKRFREESRAVSEMLTQLKTQSKATESSFCPWSCV